MVRQRLASNSRGRSLWLSFGLQVVTAARPDASEPVPTCEEVALFELARLDSVGPGLARMAARIDE